MDDIEYIKETVRKWAENEPRVTRAFIFGSFAKGTNGPDSDLDVAVEIRKTSTEENILAAWICECDGLKNRLDPLITCKLQLEIHDEKISPKVWGYMKEKNMCVYQEESYKKP